MSRLVVIAIVLTLVACVGEIEDSSSVNSSSQASTSSEPIASSSAAESLSSVSQQSSSAAAATQWKLCSKEKETCSFEGTSEVRYGANGEWATKTVDGSIECNNTAFGGDPAPRTKKTCEVPVSVTLKAPDVDAPADGAFARGKALVASPLCSACHTDKLDGTFEGIFPYNVNNFSFSKGANYEAGSQSELARYITQTMPQGNTGACDQACGNDIAAYLWSYYNPEGNKAKTFVLPAASALRKSKAMLTGLALTEDELASVVRNGQMDDAAYERLVAEWVEHPNFTQKIDPFIKGALQSYEPFSRLTLPPFILTKESAAQIILRGYDEDFYENMRTYAHRTFMDIVDKGRPFTDVVTTEQWYMTPALMSFMIAGDEPIDSGPIVNLKIKNCDKNASYEQMVKDKTFCIPQVAAGGLSRDFKSRDDGFMWARLITASGRAERGAKRFLAANDYKDWRKVKVKVITANTPQKDIIPFYDLPRLRQADTIYVRVARPGFFSTFPFLSKWRTNIDNEFRVTVNQALIVALGDAISVADETTPFSTNGLDAEHAAQPDCKACHQLLDPMRDYFMRYYDANWSKPLSKFADTKPSFSFAGFTGERGNKMNDFAQAIADHPQFAEAWVNKLCLYANSTPCSTADPEVQRVAKVFENSNFNFKSLAAAFFSSDLIKTQVLSGNSTATPSQTSVAREQHFCFNLAARMANYAGKDKITYRPCNDRQRNVSRIATALPTEDWVRGDNAPDQPSIPDLFYFSGTEGICLNVAVNKLGSDVMPNGTFEDFRDYLMHDIMGVVPGDSYYDQTKTILTDHYQDTADKGADKKKRFASLFTLACSSPFITATDF